MDGKSVSKGADSNARTGRTVMVIGGNGGLSSRYRDIVEQHGASLRHYEKKVPPSARHDAGNIALIVVMVTMVSHSLRNQAQILANDNAPVVYLKSPSVSALRAAVEERLG
jgi:hypothetical protein